MATIINGPMPTSRPMEPVGPILSMKDYAALQRAPKRPSGTQVTVRSYDVAGGLWARATGKQMWPFLKAISPDHMYAEYDDGQEQYIYRGGPRGLLLSARVDPARASPDYQRGERVLYRAELPGQTARQAVRPARAAARQINMAGQPYLLLGSNSNAVIGDLTADQLGRRVGDRQTPGYRPASPPPYPGPW